MAEMAIVAIPDDRESVWKLSSVKVPHMTLLYLGEQESDERIPHIAEYLEHAVKTSCGRFDMFVDRRGELGPDPADVLFFEKNWTARRIEGFRTNLLKDPAIFGMYNSVEQYPDWTPHLTLGYPDSPAPELDGENERIPYFVAFSKIAFWFDDFEGHEILIPTDNLVGDSDSVAWADQEIGSFLSHYGVKGMKWGVNRTREQLDSGVAKVKKAVSDREEQKKSDKARPVSDDAQSKTENLRIARNASIDRLSNKELQHLVTRMNLEKQYEGLTKGQNKSLETRVADFMKEFVGLKARGRDNVRVKDAIATAFENNKPEDWRSAL